MLRIALTRNKTALIDDEDWDLVIGFSKRWSCTCSHGVWYAQAYCDYSMVSMHRLIMGFPEGKDVHHRSTDGLDNRKLNLLVCTKSEHSRTKKWPNKSGFRGVSYEKDRRLWVAHIRIAPGMGAYKIGRFESAEEAAHAYDDAAKLFHGEFATLNFKLKQD